MNLKKSFRCRIAVVAVVLEVLGLPLSPTAAALKQTNNSPHVYNVENVFDAKTRSTIGSAGTEERL